MNIVMGVSKYKSAPLQNGARIDSHKGLVWGVHASWRKGMAGFDANQAVLDGLRLCPASRDLKRKMNVG